jgi:hypothetical protein
VGWDAKKFLPGFTSWRAFVLVMSSGHEGVADWQWQVVAAYGCHEKMKTMQARSVSTKRQVQG